MPHAYMHSSPGWAISNGYRTTTPMGSEQKHALHGVANIPGMRGKQLASVLVHYLVSRPGQIPGTFPGRAKGEKARFFSQLSNSGVDHLMSNILKVVW